MAHELQIPGHLEIAVEAAQRLQSGEWSTNEVLIAGLADLESFVRSRPDEPLFIDAGPIDEFPIYKAVINGFEKVTRSQAGKAPHGYIAVGQLGSVAAAIKALEVQNQHLVRRIAELEGN